MPVPSDSRTDPPKSQQKDLVAGVSLECGLATTTLVKSKGRNKDTSTAEAGVQVRVVIDLMNGQWVDGYSREAAPGEVTYCERSQELSATLQGMIDLGCFVDHGNYPSTPDVFDPSQCDLTEEEIQLTLKTLTANAFFFVLDDVGTGIHNVSVQARVDTATSSQAGSADASAMVGKGALTVEEVRLVKGTDITIN